MPSMTIKYQDVFNSFRGNVADYKLASLSVEDSESLMQEWLHKSFSNMYVHRLFSSFEFDDDVRELSFTMTKTVNEAVDKEFVIQVLAKQMVYEWVHPQVRNAENTAQFFGGKEQSFYSQANHLSALRGLEEDALVEVRRLINDRGFIYNDFLEG